MRALYALNAPLPQGFVYSLDVRAKMCVSLLASIITVVLNAPEAQAFLVVCSGMYAFSMRKPKALLIAYAIMLVMMLMAAGCTLIMKELLPKLMGSVTIGSLAVPFMRSLVMLHVILPMALSSRIQTILNSLRSLHLPFCIYLPAAVAVRFIPAFITDVGQVVDALKIRGHKPGFKNFMRHPVRTLRLVCAPLLFRSLRTSEDLGIAAELKGLGMGRKMVPYTQNQWKTKDTVFVLLTLVIMALAVLCQEYFNPHAVSGMR